MNKKVSVLESKIVFDDFYKLEEATYTYEMLNGEMTEPVTRLCFHRGNSVAGIVYNTSTSKAILVRQFRYPALQADGGWVTEVVAGMLGDGEDATEAMKREVEEEIGYEVSVIQYISSFYASPGGSSEKVFLYYIEVSDDTKVSEGGGLAHESEHIEVLEYSIDELKQATATDAIPDAKSIIACNYLLAKRG